MAPAFLPVPPMVAADGTPELRVRLASFVIPGVPQTSIDRDPVKMLLLMKYERLWAASIGQILPACA
jgi:hypothetical protein